MSLHRPTPHLLTVATLAVVALAGAPAQGQEEANQIVAKVKASLKDPAKPFTMIVHLKVKDGVGKKVEVVFARAIPATHREKGCLAYELNRDAQQPTQYVLYERWQNLAALEIHLKSQHITALLGELGDLLASPPEARVLLPVGDAGKSPR
jgi:quinol monooxygenase YgiN